MKLTFLFLMIGLIQVSASVYSQTTKLTLKMKDAKVVEVLDAIENQSEFRFAYSPGYIDLDRKLSVDIREKTVEESLNVIFEGTDVEFAIRDRHILLFPTSLKPGTNTIVAHSIRSVRSYQQRTVSGKVTDSDGEPLPGVSIVIKGTTQGTVTDTDGNYSLTNVSPDATLVFSFVGMKTQEILVGNQTIINIKMEGEVIGIEEVVAIGYGTVKKSDITGSVGILKGEGLDHQINTDIGKALQGKVAGVSIENLGGAPGAGVRMMIRGASTVGNNSPLVIVDGLWNVSLDHISPMDIESIQVLKDASAAAIYGAQAANGVILIQTKSGRKEKFEIEVNADYGVQELGKKLDMCNTDEWIKVSNATRTAAGLDILDIAKNPQEPGEGTDWQDALYRQAPIQKYNVLASGSYDNLNYSVSFGYLNQEGIMIETGYERMNLRLKSTFSRGNFTFGETVLLTTQYTENVAGSFGGQGGSPQLAAVLSIPAYSIYNEESEGGFNGPYGDVMNVENPVGAQKLTESYNNSYSVDLNLFGEYKLLEGLKLKSSLGTRLNDSKNFSYLPIFQMGSKAQFINSITSLGESSGLNKYWQIENTLSYNKELDSHSFNAIIGQSALKYHYRSMSASIKGMPGDLKVLNAGTEQRNVGGSESVNTQTSYFGRLIYSYDDRYIFTGTFRRDGSSRFSEKNRWGNFPSLAFAWNLSEENFFKELDLPISRLKLRGSYGALGNQEIGNYQYLGLITTGWLYNYSYGDPPIFWMGNIQGDYAATDIKWESTTTTNIGIDMDMWNNKVILEFDYFNEITTDLLLRVPIPLSVGVSSDPYSNAGKVSNKGIETTLTYNGKINDLSFSVSGIFSHIKNEVMELATGSQRLSGASANWGYVPITFCQKGYPMYSFFVIETDGLFRSEAEVEAHAKDGELIQPGAKPGDIRFVDANNDGKIDGSDRVYSGNTFPDFEYGTRLDLNYRDFDLNIFLQGVYGNKIYNGFRTQTESGRMNGNYARTCLNSYTFNKDSDFPRMILSDPNGNGESNSDRFLEDGSYLRLKTLQLGYSFPERWITGKINSARIYIGGDNLFTLTNYSGYNPDIGGRGSSLYYRGVDYIVHPLYRSYHVGIQLNF